MHQRKNFPSTIFLNSSTMLNSHLDTHSISTSIIYGIWKKMLIWSKSTFNFGKSTRQRSTGWMKCWEPRFKFCQFNHYIHARWYESAKPWARKRVKERQRDPKKKELHNGRVLRIHSESKHSTLGMRTRLQKNDRIHFLSVSK